MTNPPARQTLSEAQSKELLRPYGVTFAEESVVKDVEAAVSAAEAMDGAVAVKLGGDGIAHKTERGLVRLGVRGGAGVRAASEELLALARPEDGVVHLLVAEG